MRTREDCPSSVPSTWLRLEPSESSVGSPDALRNGSTASEIGAPPAAGAAEPPDQRPRSIHPAPASTITAAAAMSQPAVLGRGAGAGTPTAAVDVAPVGGEDRNRGRAAAVLAGLELGEHLLHPLVPRSGTRRETTGHERIEPCRDRRIDRSHRRWGLLDARHQLGHRRVLAALSPAEQQVVHDQPERVDVRALIHGLAARLLGRHVLDRADARAARSSSCRRPRIARCRSP